MATPNHTSLAAELWNARELNTVVHSDKHPTSLKAAYELQDAVTQASNQKILGYKLGATTEAALKLLSLSGPFAGPLLGDYCHKNGHTASVQIENNPGVEAEFVLGVSKDIPTTKNLTEADVADAVEWIAGGFEIVAARISNMPNARGLCTIGDGAGNHSVITGEPNHQWRELDLTALPVKLSVNGEVSVNGTSGDSLQGSPLAMLTWFANSDLVPPRGIKAGDIIYCGTCTGLTPIKPGDTLTADYGVLGQMAMTIAPA